MSSCCFLLFILSTARQQLWCHCNLCKFILWMDETVNNVLWNAWANQDFGWSQNWLHVSWHAWSDKALIFSSAPILLGAFFCLLLYCNWSQLFQRAATATPAATCHTQWQLHTSLHTHIKPVGTLNRKKHWCLQRILNIESIISTDVAECTPEYTSTVNKQNDSQIRYKCTPVTVLSIHCVQQDAALGCDLQTRLKQSYLSLNLKPFLSSMLPCVNTFHTVKSLLFPLLWFYLSCVFMSAPFSIREVLIFGVTPPPQPPVVQLWSDNCHQVPW